MKYFLFIIFFFNFSYGRCQPVIEINNLEFFCLTQSDDTSVIIEYPECLGPGIRLFGYIKNTLIEQSYFFYSNTSNFFVKYFYLNKIYTGRLEEYSFKSDSTLIEIKPNDSVYFYIETSTAFLSSFYKEDKKEYINEIKSILPSIQVIMRLNKLAKKEDNKSCIDTFDEIKAELPPFVYLWLKDTEKSKYLINK
jgi:hypothetical protein